MRSLGEIPNPTEAPPPTPHPKENKQQLCRENDFVNERQLALVEKLRALPHAQSPGTSKGEAGGLTLAPAGPRVGA